MVDSVPGSYNPFVIPPSIYPFPYFNSAAAAAHHRPMDRRAANGRRERMTYDRNQLKTLEDHFKLTPYPDATKREQLAKLLHLEENRVQVWFKNRRAKQRSQLKICTPGGEREDGGSSSVSPKDQQPRFKPVSELPFIPMPTPPKEEDVKVEGASAFTSMKKETGEEMVQPMISTNAELYNCYQNSLPYFYSPDTNFMAYNFMANSAQPYANYPYNYTQ